MTFLFIECFPIRSELDFGQVFLAVKKADNELITHFPESQFSKKLGKIAKCL